MSRLSDEQIDEAMQQIWQHIVPYASNTRRMVAAICAQAKEANQSSTRERGEMGWVSVAERLPEGIDRVLTVSMNEVVGCHDAMHVRALHMSAKTHGEECYYTHWMPLPAPPMLAAAGENK